MSRRRAAGNGLVLGGSDVRGLVVTLEQLVLPLEGKLKVVKGNGSR